MTDLRHDDRHDDRDAKQAAGQPERARRAARRTAWLFAGFALAIYLGFLFMGMLGK